MFYAKMQLSWSRPRKPHDLPIKATSSTQFLTLKETKMMMMLTLGLMKVMTKYSDPSPGSSIQPWLRIVWWSDSAP
jgi:hypothetical protein